jgi:glycosyltransferase involved in cell wall biosynthesis
LTTASKSPADDWAVNHFSAGTTVESGVTVRRFRVDRRDKDAFDRANAYFTSQPPGSRRTRFAPEHIAAYLDHNINSRELLTYLSSRGTDYDAVLFLPYPYGPVLHGVPLVRERAWLQPCLHHEAYALLPQVAEIFHAARGLLFNSDGEAELALRLYGPGLREKSHVVGEWIDRPTISAGGGGRIGSFSPAQERYVLYVGRRDETKNVGLLIESYRLYRRHDYATSLKLVLAGPGSTSFHDPANGIYDLGQVSNVQRDALLAQSLALFQPSYNESFSRVVMEAWAMARPVAVNAQCISTSLAVSRSRGGWTAKSKGEWAELMGFVDRADAGLLAEVGEAGRVYYLTHATQDGVLARYDDALWGGRQQERNKRQHFVLSVPSRDYNDELFRRALTLEAWAAEAGLRARVLEPGELPPESDDDALLVVHSPAPDDVEAALEHRGGAAVAYDPVRFAESAGLVSRLLPRALLCMVRTPDEAAMLRREGASSIEIWPFQFSLRCWDVMPDPGLEALLTDGKANCLFAGPLVPSTCCEQLVATFAYLVALESDARLVFAVSLEDARYERQVRELIDRHRLEERVVFVDPKNVRALAAAYRHASIFWSMSEGVEPRVPLVDALWHDVPILAYSTPRTVKLLGSAGLLFRRKNDPLAIAGLAKLLIRDKPLRGAVRQAQDVRRNAFTLDPAVGARLVDSLFGRVAVPAG